MAITYFGYHVEAFWFSCSHDILIIWISNSLALSIPDDDYSRNALSALNLISTFLLFFCATINSDVNLDPFGVLVPSEF